MCKDYFLFFTRDCSRESSSTFCSWVRPAMKALASASVILSPPDSFNVEGAINLPPIDPYRPNVLYCGPGGYPHSFECGPEAGVCCLTNIPNAIDAFHPLASLLPSACSSR